MSDNEFLVRLDDAAAKTSRALDMALAREPADGETARPRRLLDAMRYAALAPGKRLRPFLVIECAKLFGATHEGVVIAGAALECVHCYSLIHDDLPAMDDSDTRRGRPAVHKAFDEATAILAGDALLTLAFDLMSLPQVHADADVRLRLVSELARASGIGGMAGGQMLDLEGEGRFADSAAPDVATVQQMKTGALLRFACRAGAHLGGATGDELAALDAYGRAFGEAFQIADDLLDAEGDAALLGKQTGQDAAAGKTTFVSLLGADGARARLQKLIAEADHALESFGARAAILRAAARFVADRRS